MHKYQPLTDHLRNQTQSTYPLNFSDIEKIINDRLPASAYRHRAWWSNNPTNSVVTKAWLDAGWVSSDVDLESQRLIFRRRPQTTKPETARTNPADNTTAMLIEGLSAQTLRNLQVRADLNGQALTEVARSILEEHAKLTPSERLAMADRTRAQTPILHHVDVVEMIRAERDGR